MTKGENYIEMTTEIKLIVYNILYTNVYIV